MGQQQLLLIVLGAIIVGIAAYVGVQSMNAYQRNNERDVVIQQINTLVLDARKYAAKPTFLGGGNGKFTGYQPPNDLANTDRVRIYTGATEGAVIFTGFGSVNGEDGQSPVHIILQYTLADGKSEVEVIN
jgi:hypothetical protein